MRVATPMPSLRRRGETVSGRLLRSSRSPTRTSSLSASSSSMVRDPTSAWTPSTSFYLTPGKAVMALLDSNTLHVQGYFEETKLPRIHLGDAANVQLMGSHHTLRGRVESIAAGIEDRDRSAGATLLANVNLTFNWVRLAQRVPVRIALEQPAERNELVAGATATVGVLGPALRRRAER